MRTSAGKQVVDSENKTRREARGGILQPQVDVSVCRQSEGDEDGGEFGLSTKWCLSKCANRERSGIRCLERSLWKKCSILVGFQT